jgi:hypothetical protein
VNSIQLIKLTGLAAVMFHTSACHHGIARNDKNRLTQSITIGNVTAVSTLMPATKRAGSDEIFNSSGKTENQFYYFDIKFNRNTTEKISSEKLAYLNFDIGKDFFLVNGRDSIEAAICERVPNGIADSYEYMVAFSKPAAATGGQFSILYKDKTLGIGTLAFAYDITEKNKTPNDIE